MPDGTLPQQAAVSLTTGCLDSAKSTRALASMAAGVE
jgi:hypothetical protein